MFTIVTPIDADSLTGGTRASPHTQRLGAIPTERVNLDTDPVSTAMIAGLISNASVLAVTVAAVALVRSALASREAPVSVQNSAKKCNWPKVLAMTHGSWSSSG